MILVSFFSEDNALSDEIKIMLYFRISKKRKLSVPLFFFFWGGGTPGIAHCDHFATTFFQVGKKCVGTPPPPPPAPAFRHPYSNTHACAHPVHCS